MTTGVVIESDPIHREIRIRPLRRVDTGDIVVSIETAAELAKQLVEALEWLTQDNIGTIASMPDGKSPTLVPKRQHGDPIGEAPF